MKILQLSGPTPQPWGVDLHPRLTVVNGLPPEVAGPLREALDALVRGQLGAVGPGVDGHLLIADEQVELRQLLARSAEIIPSVPLNAASLAEAGLAAGRARALDAEVARAQAELADAEDALTLVQRDVEQPRRSSAAWRDRAAAAAALKQARLRVADAVTARALAAAARPQIDNGATQTEAQEVLRLADERITSARHAVDAATIARADAEAERARLDDRNTPETEALRAALADAERECAIMAPTAVAPPVDRALLEQRRAQVADALSALTAPPSAQVATALAAAEAHRGIDEFEAGRVAVEWERVRALVAEAEAAPPPPPPAPIASSVTMSVASAARLARANEEVNSARRSLAQANGASPLDPADVEALEAAHAEVLAAWEGSERRIGVGKARRRLEDAQLAEREILARMGFASYTEFMVSGRASGAPSPLDAEESRRVLRQAEERLVALEAQVEEELNAARAAEAASLAAVQPEPEASRVRLDATLAALRARAVELLGDDPGADVAEALRERISTDPLHDLRLALDQVGVPLGQVLTRDSVLARAREWIARAQAQASRRQELSAAQAEVEAQIQAAEEAEGARRAWEAASARRETLRAHVDALALDPAVVAAAEERVVRDRADVTRAEVAMEEAMADAERARAFAAAVQTPRAGDQAEAPNVDVALLEAEARDAQTALDVAVSHLLPSPRDWDAAASEIGRAEARVALARLERDALVAVRDERRSRAEVLDADALTWRLLTHLARARSAAGAVGPTPVLLDEPLAGLPAEDVSTVLDAIVGPASAVQVVLFSDRAEVAAWARSQSPELVGVALPARSLV